MKKLAIFGSTGNSGSYLVKEALERGYELTLLVRDSSKIPAEIQDKVSVIKGDALNYKDVSETIKKTDAVLVLIGHGKKTPPDLQTKALQNILKSMKEHKVIRLIDLTGSGVPAKGDKPSLIEKSMNSFMKLVDPNRMKDGVEHVEVIKNSTGIEWTVVRTGLQLDTDPSGDYKTGMVGDKGIKSVVSRSHIANFMLDILEDKKFYGKMPVLSN